VEPGSEDSAQGGARRPWRNRQVVIAVAATFVLTMGLVGALAATWSAGHRVGVADSTDMASRQQHVRERSGDGGPSGSSGSGASHGPAHSDGMHEVSSEFDFLVEMIPHHLEAIETAELLLEHSDRPEMHDFAREIIVTQSAEVEQMAAWLAERYPDRDTTSTYEPMMRDLTDLRGEELDQAFLEDMIPHHMMAVMMSQELLGSGLVEHDDVVPFVENIRDVQRAEIHLMRDWLVEWFGQTPGGHGMGRMHGRRG
jgi:uncharacterized protein (DUF305 family)